MNLRPVTNPDTSCRFIFDDADIRGSFIHLVETYRDVTDKGNYPDTVKKLLGEFLVAAFMLRDMIKFEGRLTLQVKGNGPIRVLMVEANSDGSARGIARLADENTSASDFRSLVGGGILAVTVEPTGKEPYQSLVPLQGDNLAACLEYYFEQSVQLGTVISLAVDLHQARGMLLQQLPAQVERDPAARQAHWQTTMILGRSLTAEELLTLDNKAILRRLFKQENETINLVSEESLRFSCSCSEERMAAALISLGEAELNRLFLEQPTIEMICEFCQFRFVFDSASLIGWVTRDSTLH